MASLPENLHVPLTIRIEADEARAMFAKSIAAITGPQFLAAVQWLASVRTASELAREGCRPLSFNIPEAHIIAARKVLTGA